MSWSLIATKTNEEARVADRLAAVFSLDCRLFVIERAVANRDRRFHIRQFPAFPEYLFVRAREMWRNILAISGVVGFVTHADGYAAIDDSVLNEIEARSRPTDKATRFVLPEPPHVSRFKFGERIQVLGQSHVAGRVGLFQTLSGPEHAIVMIEAFGRYVAVNVKETDLISAGTSRNKTAKKRQRGSGRWEAHRLRQDLRAVQTL